MPKKYKLSELPTPHNSEVILKKQPKRTLAVLQFSGFINQDHIAQKTTELLKNTKMEKIKTKGKPFFMAYDAPWTIPFLRRNEVAIEVAD
jgi:hypothetical protein